MSDALRISKMHAAVGDTNISSKMPPFRELVKALAVAAYLIADASRFPAYRYPVPVDQAGRNPAAAMALLSRC